MWLRLARRRITLPVPVSRNRFPAPLWVFIFGMVAVVSVSLSPAAAFTAVGQGTRHSQSPALALSAGPPGISPAGCCYRLGRTRYRGALGGRLARRRLGRHCRDSAAEGGGRRGAAVSGWRRGAVRSGCRRRARAGHGPAVRLPGVCLGLVLLLVRTDHHD